MREKTIKLKYPIEFEGKKYSEIKVRSPKVKDYKAAQMAKEEEQELVLISKLTGQPVEFIEELEMSDYVKLQEAIKDFLEV